MTTPVIAVVPQLPSEQIWRLMHITATKSLPDMVISMIMEMDKYLAVVHPVLQWPLQEASVTLLTACPANSVIFPNVLPGTMKEER
jgi:hypothetical protein